MTSHFNVIKKCGYEVYKKYDVDYNKHTYSIKNPYKKNEVTGTLSYEINCCCIGTLKWHIIHVSLKWAQNLTMYCVIMKRVEYAKDRELLHWKTLNVRYIFSWCCPTSNITIFYINTFGTYEICIFCIIERMKYWYIVLSSKERYRELFDGAPRQV